MSAASMLFSIGDFSNISGVSIHSLRYYDEIGALTPAYVDPVSNYRYYHLSQLGRVLAINICKDANIKLSELNTFIDDNKVDYDRLINEGIEAIDRKINEFKAQQQELDNLRDLLSVRDALIHDEELKIGMPSIKLWSMPLASSATEYEDKRLLSALSKHAREHGCRISPMFFGLARVTEGGEASSFAFAQIEEIIDAELSPPYILNTPAGEYTAGVGSRCSLDEAARLLSDDGKGDGILLSFVLITGDLDDQLHCAAVCRSAES